MFINPNTVKKATLEQLKSWGELFSINYYHYGKVKERRVIFAIHYLNSTLASSGPLDPEWQVIFKELATENAPVFVEISSTTYRDLWERVMPSSEIKSPLSSLIRGGMDEDNDDDDEEQTEECREGSDMLMTSDNSENASVVNAISSLTSAIEIESINEVREQTSSDDESFFSCKTDSKSKELTPAFKEAMEKWFMEWNQKPKVKTSKGMGDPDHMEFIKQQTEAFKSMTQVMQNLSNQNAGPSVRKVYTESTALPLSWPKKYLFYEDLYVTREGAEMSLQELFEAVIAAAEEKSDFSWASWNNCFQSKIGMEPKEKEKLHSNLRPVKHANVMKQYMQENGYAQTQMTLIHILMAYHARVKDKDEAQNVSLYAPLPIFSRKLFEPWEDWLERVDSLLENTSYANLPYQHLLDICEDEMKLTNPNYFKDKADANNMYTYINFQKTRREQMVKRIWTQYGNIDEFINLNVQAAKEGQHPIAYAISAKYLTKFFDYTKENPNFGFGNDNNYHKWSSKHRSRLLAKDADCSPSSKDEEIAALQMHDSIHLTFLESARILDSIYYTDKSRYRNKSEYKELTRQLFITEYDQKVNKNTKNESSAKKPRAEINNSHFVRTKGPNRKQSTQYTRPVPQKYIDFLKTAFPYLRDMKNTCRYQGCKSQKKYHFSHFCYTWWREDPETATTELEGIIEDYQRHQSLDRLQKALAETVHTEEKVMDDDHERSN